MVARSSDFAKWGHEMTRGPDAGPQAKARTTRQTEKSNDLFAALILRQGQKGGRGGRT